VNSNGVRTAADADLVELARTVERSIPADVDRARECLCSLDDALSTPREDGPLGSSSDAERLRSLIARIAHDLTGGRVLAVTGLERQVKYYLHSTRL
jgi:hypothetical protein